jgi:hypothetical protein
MRQLRTYIISIIVIVTPYFGYTQDSLAVVTQDSLVAEESNFALNIYVDVGKGIESLFNKQVKWEFGVSVLAAQKYLFSAELGYGSLNPEGVINNGSYTSEGNYYRAGFEYVFTISPKRHLSTGIMYAQANFNDYGNVKIISDLWDDVDETFERSDLSASWIEWIVNTEAPLFKVEKGLFSNFYWGVRFRLRILISDITQPDFDIFAIPGYGKTFSNVVPAANLYLKYRIDF